MLAKSKKCFRQNFALIICLQEKQLFSDLDKLESDLMDMLNDHIRLVQFGYDGDVDKINLLLRLAHSAPHQRTQSGPFKKLALKFLNKVCCCLHNRLLYLTVPLYTHNV